MAEESRFLMEADAGGPVRLDPFKVNETSFEGIVPISLIGSTQTGAPSLAGTLGTSPTQLTSLTGGTNYGTRGYGATTVVSGGSAINSSIDQVTQNNSTPTNPQSERDKFVNAILDADKRNLGRDMTMAEIEASIAEAFELWNRSEGRVNFPGSSRSTNQGGIFSTPSAVGLGAIITAGQGIYDIVDDIIGRSSGPASNTNPGTPSTGTPPRPTTNPPDGQEWQLQDGVWILAALPNRPPSGTTPNTQPPSGGNINPNLPVPNPITINNPGLNRDLRTETNTTLPVVRDVAGTTLDNYNALLNRAQSGDRDALLATTRFLGQNAPELTRIANEQTTTSNRTLREANLGDVSRLADRAGALNRSANPELYSLIGSLSENASDILQSDRDLIASGGTRSNYFDALGQMAGAAPMSRTVNAARVQAGAYRSPDQVMADQITSGGTLTPERVAAERIQAERISAGSVKAGQVGAGALGESLYQQALQAQQMSPLSQALQAQGLARAATPGQLTPEEIRAATQGAREGYASSGRIGDNASIAGEALARAGASRERSAQDLAMAQQINQQLLGAQQAGQALATDVLRTDIQRQQANVGTGLQADQFNVEAQLRANLANQQTGLTANQSNQDAFLRAALANQQTGMQAGMFNIQNSQEVQRLNQLANLQANLANQGANQRAGEFYSTQDLNSQQFNAQLGLSADQANRAFDAEQLQRRFNNLGTALTAEQGIRAQDRANLQNSINNMVAATGAARSGYFDPFSTLLGAGNGMQTNNAGSNRELFDQAANITSGATSNRYTMNLLNPYSSYAEDVYGSNFNAANARAIQEAMANAASQGGNNALIGDLAGTLLRYGIPGFADLFRTNPPTNRPVG